MVGFVCFEFVWSCWQVLKTDSAIFIGPFGELYGGHPDILDFYANTADAFN